MVSPFAFTLNWAFAIFQPRCFCHLSVKKRGRLFCVQCELSPGWGAIRNWPLIRAWQTKITSDQTIPDQSILWSDQSALKTPSALDNVPDQTFPDGKHLWSDQNQTIFQTIVRPSPMPNPNHRPDGFALKITSDVIIVRSKSPLIRLNRARNSHYDAEVYRNRHGQICPIHVSRIRFYYVNTSKT